MAGGGEQTNYDDDNPTLPNTTPSTRPDVPIDLVQSAILRPDRLDFRDLSDHQPTDAE